MKFERLVLSPENTKGYGLINRSVPPAFGVSLAAALQCLQPLRVAAAQGIAVRRLRSASSVRVIVKFEEVT